MQTNQQQALILSTAQAQAVYSAMSALNNVGNTAGTVTIPNGEHQDQTGSPSVTWHFAGVIVRTKYVGPNEYYDSQAAFAAAYGLHGGADQPLALARRLAYPEAGELLILDDYRNIARNILQPDGVRVA